VTVSAERDSGARILVHTGKGGVGKTTTAAATAALLASRGRRTLVASTDRAHSLADVLDTPLGDTPVAVATRLDAQQLDSRERLDHNWQDIGTYLQRLLRWGGAGELEAAELAVLPGLDEVFALLDLHLQAVSGRYDVIVVDCAPTGETLRLLSLPEVLGWYVERVMPVQRRVTRTLRPAISRVTSMPVPDDPVLGAVDALYERLQAVRAVLLDPHTTSVRMVLNPERVVLAEARRTHTLLGLFGYAADAVVVNRLLPDDADGPLLGPWRDRQRGVLAEIDRAFTELPRFVAPLAADEPVGVEALRALGGVLYGDTDPAGVLHHGPRPHIVEMADGHALRLPLPDGGAEDLELFQRDDELHVRIGAWSRNLVLPRGLARRVVTSAAFDDGWLHIEFGAPAPDDAAEVVRT
jgi:arsenite-transporting ATPase